MYDDTTAPDVDRAPDNEPDEFRDFTVTLSGYRNPWRISRMALLARHCFAADSAMPIEALADHKGTLTVRWSKAPTTRQVAKLTYAWEDMNEWEVVHEVPFGRCGIATIYCQDIKGLDRAMLKDHPHSSDGARVLTLVDTLDILTWQKIPLTSVEW